MTGSTTEPRFQLYYWPLPFRGAFVSYLFAYRGEPLLEITDYDEIIALKDQHPADQAIPFMGPPVLKDRETGQAFSQMPAIVLHVSRQLDFLPEDPIEQVMSMKVLMDCNDVLMEICRYNGSMMWERDEWLQFRSERLPHWMGIFEESLARGLLGSERVNFADIGTFALFGNMTRCLPELDGDLLNHAPKVHALCAKIGSQPSLAQYVAVEEQKYGSLYCGGQIEASIREMLKLDAEQ